MTNTMLNTPEIMGCAGGYICCENILMALKNNDLDDKRAKALQKSPNATGNVFIEWDDWEESHHMENICNAVEARANEVVRADFIEARRDAR